MNVTVAQFKTLTGIDVLAGTYKVHITNTAGVNNYVWWDWPVGMLDAIQGGLHINFFVIQRSVLASNIPSSSVVYRPGRAVPPTDANWVTVQQWDNTSYPLAGWPNNITDIWTTIDPACYRALINFEVNLGTDPVTFAHTEMSWGVPALVVPARPLTVAVDGSQPRITWTVPSLACFP